jgi:hypothetical protein
MTKDKTSVCGTYAGHQRHRKAGTPFCEPCKQARRIYARESYAAAMAKARRVASTILAARYQDEYDALVRESLVRLGRAEAVRP